LKQPGTYDLIERIDVIYNSFSQQSFADGISTLLLISGHSGTGKTTEVLAELTATVPSGSIMEMEVKTTGSNGLDIGGLKLLKFRHSQPSPGLVFQILSTIFMLLKI
jgi:hypothetical protein